MFFTTEHKAKKIVISVKTCLCLRKEPIPLFIAAAIFTGVVNCHSTVHKGTELLKVEVVKSHNCTKMSRICAKFRLLRAKLVKHALFYDFDAI